MARGFQSVLAPERDELRGEGLGMASVVHRGHLGRSGNLVVTQVMHHGVARNLRRGAHGREDCVGARRASSGGIGVEKGGFGAAF